MPKTTKAKKEPRDELVVSETTPMRLPAPLLTLAPLSLAYIVSRPSKFIRSPYVADVVTNSINSSDTVLQAHAPSLDCAGMVCKGARVFCSPSSATSKTSLIIQLCEEIREDGSYTRVGYNPNLAEKLSRQLLSSHYLETELGPYDDIKEQQTVGNSRVDFILTRNASSQQGKSKTLLEVKNVVGADYPLGRVPKERSKVGVYERDDPLFYQRAAIFPHGSHKSGIKVVSDRAIKVRAYFIYCPKKFFSNKQLFTTFSIYMS